MKHRLVGKHHVDLLVEWEDGTCTWEPLFGPNGTGLVKDDPVTVGIYASENGLVGKPGWKSNIIRKYAKTQKRIIRRANQAKLQSFRTKPVYMYGYQVPRNYRQAMELDRENGNTKWADATAIELGQIDDYETFEDMGKGYRPGPEYKRINAHLVYAVKHDGRHKARYVAGGHLTDTPIDSVYSSVVTLRGVRMLTFIAELNKMDTWVTDIGNAYLESYTKEKVYIIAGPEFGDREGHTLIIRKALYGLKSSGLRWHERFADVLRKEGFFMSKAENDIWMRDMGDHYEYIGVYVDDLIIISHDCQAIIDLLEKKNGFKLKGTGPIDFHLGCNFFRDKDGHLCYSPKKYLEKMMENYRRTFGTLPKQAASPLVKNDHPELDSTEELDLEDTKIYQSMVGAQQWAIQIGRWDIGTAVSTMSRFRAMPRVGHLDRLKRIYGYLRKYNNAIVRIRTEEPDFSDLPEKEYDWFYTVYVGANEEIPTDIPEPKGKPVVMSCCADANLYHDLITGRSQGGCLHMWNKTVIEPYTKLLTTVETATYGSEFLISRIATEQITDLRLTARYLGVPIKGATILFGDNESVVNSSSVPQSKLNKRAVALSYHKVREAVAAKMIRYYHISGSLNPADVLSKHWDMPSVWEVLRPLLFWAEDFSTAKKDGDADDGEIAVTSSKSKQELGPDEAPSGTRGVTTGRVAAGFTSPTGVEAESDKTDLTEAIDHSHAMRAFLAAWIN